MMASQGNALPEMTAEDWCGVMTPNEVNDTHITELLERLIDEAGLEVIIDVGSDLLND
jgi:hypothetical protein